MAYVKIDPPGSFCTYEALRDVVRAVGPRSFVDVGCGAGDISKVLCSLGMTGTGVDFSPQAIDIAAKRLASEIQAGSYDLVQADAAEVSVTDRDFAVSCMVMEHIEDDVGFAQSIASMVKPGGHIAIFVPGRKDRWTFEDDTVGHLRRYERGDLMAVMQAAGASDIEIWSVAVPTANLLLGFSDALVRRAERSKTALSQRAQTEASGVREIPWKTVFPPWVRFILNRITLAPLFWLQRLFYRSDFGIILLGVGRVTH